MSEHEAVVLPWGTWIWYNRSPEEIEDERQRDITSGDTLTSDGEPRLYSSVGLTGLRHNTTAVIIRKRGVTWNGLRARPKHLVEGLVTIDGAPRIVMFSYGPREKAFQESLKGKVRDHGHE